MKVSHNIKGRLYFIDGTSSLYAGCLNQSNMVGGTGNREEHHSSRADYIGNRSVLDYGCGRGDFVEYLKTKGIDADGYDPYSDTYRELPTRQYDVVTMIEVIEHTCAPYSEIDEIRNLLNPDGILFVETSFTDWVGPDHPYLNPDIGHSTIFSHRGLDLLMKSKGFVIGDHVNQNIRIFKKSVDDVVRHS
jgi:2-polyprenyl-3-methyl-5-hydroxy-6-metoxy-1,4-benzoquinol methylase